MFKINTIEKYYGITRGYYLIYESDKQKVVFPEGVDINVLKNRWDKIDEVNFFKNLIISPYHMLLKTPELKELLEYIYNNKIPEENELIEAIKLQEEILNYEEVFQEN